MSRFRLLAAVLLGLVLVASISALPAEASKPRKWPGRTITYVDKSKDPDAVKLAVRAWNRSGLRIRFKEVRKARTARLVIRNTKRVPAGCGTGYGTLGYPGARRKAYVSILHGTDADGQGCAWPGQALVVAHELGHVLGLDHYDQKCSLMNSSHTNGVAPSVCIGDDFELAKPGTWRCRLLEPVDLKHAKRIYGGRPRVSDQEWCDAIDKIPGSGPVVVVPDSYGNHTLVLSRAPEPVVPAWLGTWGYGAPGYEVHVTPAACTAVPGDETTLVDSGLWGATPVGGTLDVPLHTSLPPGPSCVSVWQFDQAYNFAKAPATVMVDGGLARPATPAPQLSFRTPTRVFQLD